MTTEQKFNNSYIPEPMSGCWLWIAGNRGGSRSTRRLDYGYIWHDSRMIPAHRYSYSIHVSEPSPENHIHHKCNNTFCVNPDHLQELTPEEHVLVTDGCAGFIAANSTHCPNGHELPKHRGNQTNRACRECQRERSRKYKATKSFNRFKQERKCRSGQAEKTHCPSGHEYSEENTGWRTDPYGIARYCKTCNAIKANKAYHAKPKIICQIPIPEGSKCKNGHDHKPDTCYVGGRGGLVCRICREATTKATAAKKKIEV